MNASTIQPLTKWRCDVCGELIKVAYVGYGALRAIFVGTADVDDTFALMSLTLDASEPAKYRHTLADLLARHQAQMQAEL